MNEINNVTNKSCSPTHVADGLPQPLRNARKLGVNYFETLLPGEHKMGLKKNFIVANFFNCDFKIFT